MSQIDNFPTDFADINTGVRLHYVDTGGDGLPVIAVHGMLGTAKLHFTNVIEWLAPSYRVIGPTMRGYGKSSPQTRTFSIDFYQQDARDLIAFMDALNIEKAHLLGYSDGGEIVLLVAGMQPERVASVATIGAVGYFGEGMRPSVQNMFPATWITEDDVKNHNITNKDAFVLGWIKAVRVLIDSGGDLSLTLAKNITAPLLVMLGEQDCLNPIAYGQKLADNAQNGRVVAFKTGHPIHDEDWDGFKRVYGDFLKNAE